MGLSKIKGGVMTEKSEKQKELEGIVSNFLLESDVPPTNWYDWKKPDPNEIIPDEILPRKE